MAQCPVHDDRTESLSFRQGEKGAVFTCHAGCEKDDILFALDLSWQATFDNEGKGGKAGLAADLWMPCQLPDNGSCAGHKSAEYRYTDEEGNFLYAVARCSRKGDGCPQPFAQWTADPSKRHGKKWGLPGAVRRVLYDLVRVIRAAKAGRRIWILEGEKDVERMKADFPDEVATTAMSGAGKSKWRLEYTKCFAGACEVIIVADCDRPGLDYAEEVHRHVSKVVDKVQVVCSPLMEDGADFSDHRDYGFGLDEFEVVPFEKIKHRPRMVIEVEERHQEKPVIFNGYSQSKVERSLVGSMLKHGLHYEVSEADIKSSERLRITVGAINRLAAQGSLIFPDTVAVEIENAGKGDYERVVASLLELEKAAFDDVEKPKKAARILRERSVREGIAYSCRATEEAVQDERWGIEEVLAHMKRLTESHADEYAALSHSFGAPTGDVFTGDIVEKVAREEGIPTGNVRELRPAAERRRETAARTS